jgi:hypothetical protein
MLTEDQIKEAFDRAEPDSKTVIRAFRSYVGRVDIDGNTRFVFVCRSVTETSAGEMIVTDHLMSNSVAQIMAAGICDAGITFSLIDEIRKDNPNLSADMVIALATMATTVTGNQIPDMVVYESMSRDTFMDRVSSGNRPTDEGNTPK